MKVAIVTPQYPPNIKGGGEISVQLLSKRLNRSDRVDKISVFTFDRLESENIDGVQVVGLGRLNWMIKDAMNILAYRKLKYKLSDFDIIHSYNMSLHPVVGKISDSIDIPAVATLNSDHYLPESSIEMRNRPIIRAYKYLFFNTTGKVLIDWMSGIDTYFSLSSSMKKKYESTTLPNEKIVMVPNMADPEFDKLLDDIDPEVKNQTPTKKVLYVGTLRKTKGVEYLIRAGKHLPENFQIVIVGDGPQEKELHEIADELGLNIQFAGRVEYKEIPEYMRKSDVFVHPGVWPEPFGRTILEAMQAGLPVVTTDRGAPKEIVPFESLVCEAENSQDLAETIQSVVTSDYDIDFQQYVHSNYSPEKITRQIINHYETILNE
ncbi:glycosyltransferase family 4 protein [Haloferax volcanii]|uniref:glycosyltransferase family 4 protein n=1 Tax=Haloferax volcanii TaxID=2246 RepID=UPI003853FC2F